jgi:hypothetical protein
VTRFAAVRVVLVLVLVDCGPGTAVDDEPSRVQDGTSEAAASPAPAPSTTRPLQQHEARGRAFDTLRMLRTAVRLHWLKHRRLPVSLQELCGPRDDPKRILHVESPPEDPWGRDYVYSPGEDGKFKLATYGADGAPGGDAADRDIEVTEASLVR